MHSVFPRLFPSGAYGNDVTVMYILNYCFLITLFECVALSVFGVKVAARHLYSFTKSCVQRNSICFAESCCHRDCVCVSFSQKNIRLAMDRLVVSSAT